MQSHPRSVYKSGHSLILLSCYQFISEKFCSSTTTKENVSHQTTKVLLFCQNVSHQRKFLLFCYTKIAECFSPEKNSGVLLPQLQNFNFLCTRENLCPSATTTPEFFSPDRSSAVPLPQLQNVSHQRIILLFCYHNCRIFLSRKIFCYHNCRMFLT